MRMKATSQRKMCFLPGFSNNNSKNNKRTEFPKTPTLQGKTI
jgi:hypothetical protein